MPILILLSIILLLLGIYLYLENKKLKQKIKDLEQENKTILERKIMSNKEDLIPIENISIEIPQKENMKIVTQKQKETKNTNNIPQQKTTNQKYVARNTNDDIPTLKVEDPIATKTNKSKDITLSTKFNPTEFIKNTNNTQSTDKDLQLKTIVKQIEELINEPITLTDYEQKQEEQAIISYQELLSLKEKHQNSSNKDKSFLEDLKELRKLLD